MVNETALISSVMQIDIDGKSNNPTPQLAAYTIWLCADFFYGLYALVLAFALGRFCLCCKCCCDDEDDWVYDY